MPTYTYKSITQFQPATTPEDFLTAVNAEISILTSQGKTDGNQVLTYPNVDTRQIERIWVDQAAAQGWIDWLANNLTPPALSAQVEPI